MRSMHPVAEALFWLALVLALSAAVYWLARRLRGSAVEDTSDPSEMLTKFRLLHAAGGLSDTEYRTIKAKLATQLQAEGDDPNDQSSAAGGEGTFQTRSGGGRGRRL